MDREDDQVVSPATEQEDVTDSAAASTATDENPDSSPDGAASEESFGDVVSKAMEGEQDDPEDPEAKPEDAEGEGKAEGEKAPDADPDRDDQAQKEAEKEDDGADLQEGQRVPYDRFKKVIDQRNQYKEREAEISRERDTYKTGHEQYQAIQSFMSENELRPQDVVEALTIAAQMNRDPAGALEALKGKMSGLQEFTGERLPQDLQQRVDTGEIDQRDAQEIVRQRNENALLKRRQAETAQRQQQETEQRTAQQTQQEMAKSANQVQQELAQRDPDFDRKLPWIETKLKVLIQERQPQTAEQAGQLVREAHQTVSRDLEKTMPRRNIRPGPSSQSAGGTTSSPPEPASMAEAIQRAMDAPPE